MREFDIEFEVTQIFTYVMSVEANTPEEAVKKLQDPDFDTSDAEEDGMLESTDNRSTAICVGERVASNMLINSTHRIHLKDSYETL